MDALKLVIELILLQIAASAQMVVFEDTVKYHILALYYYIDMVAVCALNHLNIASSWLTLVDVSRAMKPAPSWPLGTRWYHGHPRDRM